MMRTGDNPTGTAFGRDQMGLVQIGATDDGNPIFALSTTDAEAVEHLRVCRIRLGNCQKLLEALLEQNQKGVKTKAELNIDLVPVPTLEEV